MLRREVFYAEPHALDRAETASVDLAMLAPSQPGVFEHGVQSWLRAWWLGVDLPGEVSARAQDLCDWRGSTNEVLVEMARVVKPGGRVVIRTGQGRIGSKVVHYNREIEGVVSECLPKFWRVEGSISERCVDTAKARAEGGSSRWSELVVLRRR
jgi:hypothetical protein